MSGHSWDTYSYIEEHGLLEDVQAQPWEGPCKASPSSSSCVLDFIVERTIAPNLHFVAHLPHTVKGEQLIAQLYRCIPEHSWLFQYGRTPMSILLSEFVFGVRHSILDWTPELLIYETSHSVSPHRSRMPGGASSQSLLKQPQISKNL